jgi:hypothetical protein
MDSLTTTTPLTSAPNVLHKSECTRTQRRLPTSQILSTAARARRSSKHSRIAHQSRVDIARNATARASGEKSVGRARCVERASAGSRTALGERPRSGHRLREIAVAAIVIYIVSKLSQRGDANC